MRECVVGVEGREGKEGCVSDACVECVYDVCVRSALCEIERED